MTRKEVQKELAKTIRSILNFNGFDGNYCVRLYKETSVECHLYGKQKEKECVLKALRKYPNFEESDCGYIWKDGRSTIYITIA